jgi:hypothetical protein
LEIESKWNVFTVILHGFGGIWKTTLVDVVFSQVGGCRNSQFQLFVNIDYKTDIIKLQKDILKYFMRPKDHVPDIKEYHDGQREMDLC